MATKRQITFLINANAERFAKGFSNAEKSLKRFARRTGRIGRSMSRNITLPLALASGAALKLSTDFDKSMTRIETLVGLSREQVQGMRQDVLDLAGQTAKAPQELSRALFTVTSAGIRGAESMDVLERASKAAAIGLGDTREIARATTAILQAYSDEGITAAEATDTLTAIVREGNLEASELAPVLGRVVGIASQVGVSFEEVGASIATFTRLGVSTEEAVTGLRGVMNALIKPSEQGRDALQQVGLSFEGLRRQVEEEGLMAALRGLVAAFDGNIEGLTKVIPRVRALAAVMGTAGAQGEAYEQILRNIEGATGIVDEGFERVSQTTAFKFNQAIVNLKKSGIELGSILVPVANKIIGSFNNLIKSFSNLSEGAKKNILIVAGVIGAGGPLLIAVSAATKALAGLAGIMSAAFSPVTLTILGVVAAISGIIIIGKTVVDNWNVISAELTQLFQGIKLVAIQVFNSVAEAVKQSLDFILAGIESVSGFISPAFSAGINGARKALRNGIDSMKGDLETAKTAFEQSKQAAADARKNITNLGTSFNNLKKDITGAFQNLFAFNQGAAKTSQPNTNSQPGLPTRQIETTGLFGNPEQLEADASVFKKVAGEVTASAQRMTDKAKVMGTALQQTVSSAVSGFAETLGNAFTGDAGAEGFFNNLLLIVVDFANQLGRLLIAAGTAALAFKSLFANPVAAIAAGAALVALTTIIKNLLKSGPGDGNSKKVNDALITSKGQVIEFAPNDDILAAPGLASGSMPVSAGNSNGMVDALDKVFRRNTKRLSPRDLLIISNEGQRQFNR